MRILKSALLVGLGWALVTSCVRSPSSGDKASAGAADADAKGGSSSGGAASQDAGVGGAVSTPGSAGDGGVGANTGNTSGGRTTNAGGNDASAGDGDPPGDAGRATTGEGGRSGTGGSSTSGGSGANIGGNGGPEAGASDGGSCPGPNCPAPTCGDGIVTGEECDDGNTQAGDGCSSTCHVEAGYTCTAAQCDSNGQACVLHLPATFHDFNPHAAVGGHPDFQPEVNSAGAIQGLVQPDLDSEGKPVLSATASPTNGFMHGAAAFAQWYRDGAPGSAGIVGDIALWQDQSGGYVNRWGKKGERWVGFAQTTYTYCTSTCDACGTPEPGRVCYPQCPLFASNYACIATPTEYDGTPLFFPIDSGSQILADTRLEAKVPEQYGWAGWPWEPTVATQLGITTPLETSTAPFPSMTHNFAFTTEVKFWFRYDASKPQALTISGDDDIWLFINGHLAADLGGWHVPLDSAVTISAGTLTSVTNIGTVTTAVTKTGPVSAFGLVDGNVYSVAVFHAERQPQGSSFKLALKGLDVTRSVCEKP